MRQVSVKTVGMSWLRTLGDMQGTSKSAPPWSRALQGPGLPRSRCQPAPAATWVISPPLPQPRMAPHHLWKPQPGSCRTTTGIRRSIPTALGQEKSLIQSSSPGAAQLSGGANAWMAIARHCTVTPELRLEPERIWSV